MSKVPIQNLYFLLSYAWDRLDEAELIGVSATDSPNLVDLLARVLVEGLSQLLRQGLDRGYLARSEDTSRPRGQIELGPSLRLMAQADLRLRCTFHELSYDVPQNRILKAAL